MDSKSKCNRDPDARLLEEFVGGFVSERLSGAVVDELDDVVEL